MIVITTHSDPLLFDEFVKPVLEIAGKAEIAGFADRHLPEKASNHNSLIITGTALKDFAYLEHLGNFSFLRDFRGNVFGICAGAQIMLSVFNGKPGNAGLIGKRLVELEADDPLFGPKGTKFPAYFVFSNHVVSEEFETIGVSEGIPVLFRRGGMWASYFHPEVLNREALSKFVSLGNEQ